VWAQKRTGEWIIKGGIKKKREAWEKGTENIKEKVKTGEQGFHEPSEVNRHNEERGQFLQPR